MNRFFSIAIAALSVVVVTSGRADAAGLQTPRTLEEHIQWLTNFAASANSKFDYNHDGRLQFDEYLDEQYAAMSMYVRPGGRLDKAAYLQAMLGPNSDPVSRRAASGVRGRNYAHLFDTLDRGHKGFLTRDDLIPRERRIFLAGDRNRSGAIEPGETAVGAH